MGTYDTWEVEHGRQLEQGNYHWSHKGYPGIEAYGLRETDDKF